MSSIGSWNPWTTVSVSVTLLVTEPWKQRRSQETKATIGKGALVSKREIYPSAPLRLVSLELKFPATTRTLTRRLWDELEAALAQDLSEITTFPPDPDSHIPSGPYDPVLRRMSEGLKRAVTLYAGALTVELADYTYFEDLATLTRKVLEAFDQAFDSPLPCTRIGLRYINEIRAEALQIPADSWQALQSWRPFINQELVRGVEKPPEGLCAFSGPRSIFFHSTTGPEYVSINYGIHPEGVVDPDDVLTLDGVSGPCFVLDFDAFQAGATTEPIASKSSDLIDAIHRLNKTVESVFQWSITDRSREVFRAEAHSSSGMGPLPHASSA